MYICHQFTGNFRTGQVKLPTHKCVQAGIIYTLYVKRIYYPWYKCDPTRPDHMEPENSIHTHP